MAITREEISNSKIQQLLAPMAVNVNRNDIPAVDISGFDSLLFTVQVGATAAELGGANSLLVRLAHSDNNIDFENCEFANVLNAHGVRIAGGTLANIYSAEDANTAFTASYIGHRRFVKPVITVLGDLGDGVHMAISATLYNPKYRPVTLTEELARIAPQPVPIQNLNINAGLVQGGAAPVQIDAGVEEIEEEGN